MAIQIPYNDLLKLLTKQMEDSGIKEYCQKICYGRCCSHCDDVTDQYKNKICEKKVSCLNFLCNNIRFLFSVLKITDSLRQYENYSPIINQIHKYIGGDPYFTPYDEKLEQLVFEIEPEKLLKEQEIKNIRKAMDYLSLNHINLRLREMSIEALVDKMKKEIRFD